MTEMESVLRELVRLKTLRDVLGDQEKAGKIGAKELKAALLLYGREKKIAWARAREVLGLPQLL